MAARVRKTKVWKKSASQAASAFHLDTSSPKVRKLSTHLGKGVGGKKGEIQRETQIIMSNSILNQSLLFDSSHKVTAPFSAVTTAKPCFSCQQGSDAFLEQCRGLRTSCPDISPCSCSSQTPFDPHCLTARFFKCFSQEILPTTLNYETNKSVAILTEAEAGPELRVFSLHSAWPSWPNPHISQKPQLRCPTLPSLPRHSGFQP